jgi:phospholipid/cholesterol/gamma-HCH transport system substrate-binding protein
MSRRSIAEIAAGAGVLAVAIGFLGYAVLQGGRAPQMGGQALTAGFERVDGLNAGSDVKIAGVKVGSVVSMRIDPQTFQAQVVMRVQPGLRLPTDTSAEVQSEGLLGGKYISLVPGGSDRVLADGGRIMETQGSVSLESLLGRFIFSVTQMNAATPPAAAADASPPR